MFNVNVKTLLQQHIDVVNVELRQQQYRQNQMNINQNNNNNRFAVFTEENYGDTNADQMDIASTL